MPLARRPYCHQGIPLDSAYLGSGVTCPFCHRPFVVTGFVPVQHPDSPVRPPQRRAAPQRNFLNSWALVLCSVTFLGVVVSVGGLLVWIKANGKLERETTSSTKVERSAKPAESPIRTADVTLPVKMDAATMARVKAATVYVRVGTTTHGWTGSGFYVGRGLVMTNHHAIDHPGRLEVTVHSGSLKSQTHDARVVRSDRDRDLALLEVEGDSHPAALSLAGQGSVIETQDVYIFGFPFGERLGEGITVAKSSVSSFRTHNGLREIQINGGIHSGNSGGPVTDAAGRVIGVSYAAVTGSQISLAIAGDEAVTFLAEYRRR